MEERIEVNISSLSPGMIIAKNVWDESGKQLLIGVDKKVTNSMIKRLLKHKISSVFVYIEVKETEHFEPLDIVLKDQKVVSLNASEKEKTEKEKPAANKTAIFKPQDINVYNTFYLQISNLLNVSAREIFKPDVDIETIKHPIMAAITSKEIMNLLIELRVKAQYLLGHSIEVALLCSAIGVESGMQEKRLRNLILAALLHDIGMIQIRDDILFKVEPLMPYEVEILKSHASKSVLMLKEYAKLDKEVFEIIYQHHERVNGSGYPKGLTDNVISNSAKILSAADVYSAISHERCYRNKLHPQEKIEFLFASGNHYFSYDIVKKLLDKVSIYYKGQWVKLNTGHVGIISGVDPSFPTRPYIRLIYDEKGNLMSNEKEVFLGDRIFATLLIEKII